MPVQPDFEIEARIPDADDRSVPNWSDLTLVITQEGMGARRLDLTRGAGEAVADAIHGVLHPWAGKSIIEHLWDALDEAMVELMDGPEPRKPRDGERLKGYALGLATALATMYNPLNPNVDEVRATALERYADRD